MSYDIRLLDPVSRETLTVDHAHHMRGGTYRLGGTEELRLNVTYNYAPHFQRTLGENGIRSIYGMTGAESLPVLQAAFEQLEDDNEPNYWNPTEGNAKRALAALMAFARLRPDGVWEGD